MALQENRSHIVEVDGEQIDLRNRALAALLAWLIPGAGHFYQRRYRKGILFSVCILLTYFFGFAIGGGHVVYASWTPGDYRYHYIAQVGVGLPALPALAQAIHLNRHMRPDGRPDADYEPLWEGVLAPEGEGLMAPPRPPVFQDHWDQLAKWHEDAKAGFELGSWYTMIAGLLNVLVIFDAYSGPLAIPISGKSGNGSPEGGADSSEPADSKKRKRRNRS